MSLLDKLERKFHKFAIKGLMLHIVILNMTVYMIHLLKPEVFNFLYLDPGLIMKGQVWRLLTYIFIPPVLGIENIIWIVFVLSFYYTIGMSLEREWGSFRFNLFYLVGMLGTTAASFILNHFFGGTLATATYLNMSLFLAFARIFPDYEILLFFFIPVKVKYMAWLAWFFFGLTVLVPLVPLTYKVAVVVAILNYFLFFGRDIVLNTRGRGSSVYRKTKYKMNLPRKDYRNKCTVCGVTDKDNPQMEFRYCSGCEGDYEYCMEHLRNHEHVSKENDQ
ncbi:MAG: rhomboid family intramembrane serine protease [Clostridiaceae bacterium]|nr:rhomboid family intramembrane serine protease [Clostridiaceae bacterium]